MNVLKEPLLHFLAIGAVLFGVYALVNPDAVGTDKRIVVDDGRVRNLVAVFERTWNRPPTPEEMNRLVDNFVLEEIYYREALAMGIDKNDPMIRRRMRQKMEFLTADAASVVGTSDAELQQYLDDHPDIFRTEPVYSFRQIYINTDRPDAELQRMIGDIQVALERGEQAGGDRTLLPERFSEVTGFEVRRTLGEDFAARLDALEPGGWRGPVHSGLGVHFVKLESRRAGQVPALAAIREVVERELLNDRHERIRRAVEKQLMAEYEIVIDYAAESDRG